MILIYSIILFCSIILCYVSILLLMQYYFTLFVRAARTPCARVHESHRTTAHTPRPWRRRQVQHTHAKHTHAQHIHVQHTHEEDTNVQHNTHTHVTTRTCTPHTLIHIPSVCWERYDYSINPALWHRLKWPFCDLNLFQDCKMSAFLSFLLLSLYFFFFYPPLSNYYRYKQLLSTLFIFSNFYSIINIHVK